MFDIPIQYTSNSKFEIPIQGIDDAIPYSRKSNRRKGYVKSWGTFDFETYQAYPVNPHYDRNGVKLYTLETGVAFGCAKIGDDKYEFTCLDAFMDWVLYELEDTKLFAHNLGFDFSFIEPFLIEHNIRYTKKVNQELVFVELGKNVILSNTSLIFTGQSLASLGEIIGNYKIDNDPIYYKGHVVTEKDWEYCHQDCEVLYDCVKKYCQIVNDAIGQEILKPIDVYTGASCSYRVWKSLVDPELYKKLVIATPNKIICADAIIGGYVYSRPGRYKNIYKYDITNAYPASLVDFRYPLGDCHIKNRAPSNGELYLIRFKHRNTKLKSDKHIPFMEHRLRDVMTLTSVDFELFKENYYTEIYDATYYVFTDSIDGSKLFGCFVYKIRDLMERLKYSTDKNDKAIRHFLKTLYNGLFGKFLSRIMVRDSEAYFDDDGIVINKKGAEHYEEALDKYYTPIGIFCTAYCRTKLFAPIKDIGMDKIVATDTDCLCSTVDIDEKYIGKFGKFGLENDGVPIKDFVTLAPKTYAYIGSDDELHFTCKGMRKNMGKDPVTRKPIPTFNDLSEFKLGFTAKQLKFITVRGGKAATYQYKTLALL